MIFCSKTKNSKANNKNAWIVKPLVIIYNIFSKFSIYFQVHLIEQLETACIRFVHFSKENELRSRVFSEKMGLESGWNCHISLLSERSR